MTQQACHPVETLESTCINRILSCVKYKHFEDLNQLNIPQMFQDKLFASNLKILEIEKIEFKSAFIPNNGWIEVLKSNTTSLKLNELKYELIHVEDLRVCRNDPNDLHICHDLFDNNPHDSLRKAVQKFRHSSPNNLMNLLKCDMQNSLKCGVCQIYTSAHLRIYVDNDGNEYHPTVCDRCVVNLPDNVNSPKNVVNIHVESTYRDKVCHWLPYVKDVMIIYKHYEPICCTDVHADVIIQDYIRHHYANKSIEFDTDKCNFRIGNIDYECSIRNTLCFVQKIARELIERNGHV